MTLLCLLTKHCCMHFAAGAAGGQGIVPGGGRRASAAAAAADSVSLSVRRWDELEKAVKEQVW